MRVGGRVHQHIYQSQMQIVACTAQHVSLHVKLHWSPGLLLQAGDTITQMLPRDITRTKYYLAYASHMRVFFFVFFWGWGGGIFS